MHRNFIGEANLTCVPAVRHPHRQHQIAFAGALLLLAAVSVILSLAYGSRSIPFAEALRALFLDLDSDNATVITSQRMPRTLLGVASGLGLGLAGALMQGHTRNPLADPGLFGVNSGATFGVVVLVFGLGVVAPAAIVAAALIGAGVVSTVVLLLGLRASRGGGLVMLAVIGTTVGALLAALSTAVLVLDRSTLDVLRFWQVGDLQLRDLSLLWLVGPLYLVGVALAVANSFPLNSLALGDEVAASLGTRVRTARIIGIIAITLLAGTTTAVCGPIGFLGLVAPHIVRSVTKHDQRWLIPLSGLVGVSLVLLADTLGRIMLEGTELEVGIVMALIGGPVLLALTRRRKLAPL